MNTISITINGERLQATVSPDRKLIDFLHEDASLTGTKICCGLGICKACTVAFSDTEGAPLQKIQACITSANEMDGKHILTIEGIAKNGRLSALQEAFLKHFSFQCGYSTPGFLLAATILLDQLQHSPISEDNVDDAILAAVGQNLCRCTGYVRYFRAIKEVVLQTPGLVVKKSFSN